MRPGVRPWRARSPRDGWLARLRAEDTLLLAQPLTANSQYFVGWGTLALVNAGLAQGKNRSGLAWFLISLLLGPIATFVLVAFCEKK